GPDNVLLSNEELDIIGRLAARGLAPVYAPDACVEHRIDPARIAPEWLRSRVAWQAVSDCIIRAPSAAEPLAVRAERLRRFINRGGHIHPPYFAPTLDADRCREEMQNLYDVVVALLAGGIARDVVKGSAGQAAVSPSRLQRFWRFRGG
ncbi:MAG: hypothetical protein ACREIP_08990, partial [Alphaproteobacteria bacterium]